MNTIIIDIETCPAQDPAVRAEIAASIEPPGNISKAETIAAWHAEKKPAAVEEAWRKTSFDGASGHICVLGLAFNDEEPLAFWVQQWHQRESEMLQNFFNAIDEHIAKIPNQRPVFVGHNIIDFDFRFIFQRAVVLGVKPSIHIPFNARGFDSGVFDTMTRWAGYGNRVKLDKLARALGVGSKGDIDGSKVWDYVRDGKIQEVAEYCKNDIAMTREIYKRMVFMQEVF
jgi:DNA polymerase elongation subunit (family B)